MVPERQRDFEFAVLEAAPIAHVVAVDLIVVVDVGAVVAVVVVRPPDHIVGGGVIRRSVIVSVAGES